MTRTHHSNVYLDLSHLDPAEVHARFPGMAQICAKFGLDLARDRIPVRPGAHYMIGGAVVDDVGRTTLPGLLAAGEVTSSGLHGANRLASNSLLEGLVYGARAGADVTASWNETSPKPQRAVFGKTHLPTLRACGRRRAICCPLARRRSTCRLEC